ncbi:MAG: hypothetical protein SGI77_00555 [Pirellulaceae bacterium]|nr:hypothetical protein [Pirellulaceae bacterium]
MLKSSCLIAISFVFGATVFAQDDQPTHRETEPIKIDLGVDGKIETMAMNSDGNLLLGVSWSADGKSTSKSASMPSRPNRKSPSDNPLLVEGGPRSYAIRIISPTGQLVNSWDTQGLRPSMIHACEDGEVYFSGSGKIVRLNSKGELIHSIAFDEILDGLYAKAHASGVTADNQYFFIAFGEGFSMRATEDIVRLNRDLSEAKVMTRQQFGCCSHIDLDVKEGKLYVAENSRHRVNRFSLDGEKIDTWGARDRTRIEGFAACCNPVNFDWGPDGDLYTAESGIGRVKRYSADGMYLGLVGYVDTTKFDNGSMLAAMSCYIPVEVAKDGKRIYIMDIRANFIRVLEQ